MPDYDYHGLMASTWDIWRDDTANWQDRSFYAGVIGEYGEPVLDLGCGTGRLLLDYIAQGIDVDGVDNSAEMLDICRAKAAQQGLRAPALYQQEIEHRVRVAAWRPARYRLGIAVRKGASARGGPALLRARRASFARWLRNR